MASIAPAMSGGIIHIGVVCLFLVVSMVFGVTGLNSLLFVLFLFIVIVRFFVRAWAVMPHGMRWGMVVAGVIWIV